MLEKYPKESFEKKETVGRVGFSEHQGIRKTMEDAHVIEAALGGDPNRKFFAIYDGHGGRKGADLAAKKLHGYFDEAIRSGAVPKEAMRQAFIKVDQDIEELEDDLFLEFGTTAIVAYFEGNKLLIANAGDARATIVRSEEFERLSKDHKPHIPSEKERIEKAGGVVGQAKFYRSPDGEIRKRVNDAVTEKSLKELGWKFIYSEVPRVNDRIAMSRALGDHEFDNSIISPEPYIREVEIGPDDRKIIIACDGIWDVITDMMAADMVRDVADPQSASELLVKDALKRKTTDNVSVIVLNLNEQSGAA